MFKQMFDDFGVELPVMTRFVFTLASMVTLLKWPIMLGLGAFSLALVLLFVGSRWTIAIFDRIPFWGDPPVRHDG